MPGWLAGGRRIQTGCSPDSGFHRDDRQGADMNIALRATQGKVFTSDKRFRVLAAGRRFGKTFLAAIELCRAAWFPGRKVWYVGPTYKQANRIMWVLLKEL